MLSRRLYLWQLIICIWTQRFSQIQKVSIRIGGSALSLMSWCMHICSLLEKDHEPVQDKSKFFGQFKGGQGWSKSVSIAWMQMYFTISQLYQPGGPQIELFESDETDVRLACGYVFPQPKLSSKGVKILVHSLSKTPEHNKSTNWLMWGWDLLIPVGYCSWSARPLFFMRNSG